MLRGMPKGLFEGYWNTVTSRSYFWDTEWRQRRDINDLEGAEVALESNQNQLAAANAQLHRHVMDLTMTVAVLVQLLEEAGHVDSKALRARVEAEIAKSRPAAAPVVDPWAQPGAAPAAPAVAKPVAKPAPVAAQVTCVKCGATVPASRTTITEAGTVCDKCAP